MIWKRSLALLFFGLSAIVTRAAPLELQKGDHICLIGNTLAERMQHAGWVEAYVVSRFPTHDLVFRNLGYSGDEIELGKRLRSMDFGSPDQWLAGAAPIPQPNKLNKDAPVSPNRFALTNTRADVVWAFFGYNESFAGAAGIEAFKKNLDKFISDTLAKQYNGRSAPRLVLFSPIAHEDLKSSNLPDGNDNNFRLKLYTEAMTDVAKARNVPFVDLFSASLGLYAKAAKPLTINGIHLNAQGEQALAPVIDEALFGAAPQRDAAQLEKLRLAIVDKNVPWYHRYRATDGYSTYGDRAFLRFMGGQSNYEVGQRELEMLDVMTANRDQRVWAVAQGKDLTVADDNLPPHLPVTTNKPGTLPNGRHLILGGEEAIAKMTVHKNMKVTLFADEKTFPDLINPVQMAFDTKGRLWVATWPTYPHWKPTTPRNDSLLILEDTDGDGRADKRTVFAGDLHNPTGFEFWNGGVLVAQGPALMFLKDTNGDDKYDESERVLHGMDTADTHHTANSFTLDPGGALYFQEGTFHHSQIETPWGSPLRVANGAVFRFDPRQMKPEVYVSFGFANPHGHVFDRWGQDIVWDGTGAQPYHALLFSSDMDYPHKHRGPPQVYKQRTRPCSGTEILSSSHFPEEFRGNLLVNNVIGFQGILRYKVQDNESSFSAVELEPIVSSSDPNFRPADVEVGPDGAIYFVDWHNPIIGHMQHNLRDPSRNKINGRVYRVAYEGRPLTKSAAIAGQPIEKLLDLLKEKDDRVRYRTRIELSGRPSGEVIAATKKWLAALDKGDPDYEHHVLEALWLHQSHNVVDAELVKRVLCSPEPKARAAATRVLAYWRQRVSEPLELLRAQVNDENGRVRLQAIWALSFFNGTDAAKAAEVAVESLIHPQDAFHKHQLEETNRTLNQRIKATKK